MVRKSNRKGFKKGTRSRTRPGHKNFETYKGSKRYSEKLFKRKFGKRTGRAPFFPFAGGKSHTSKQDVIALAGGKSPTSTKQDEFEVLDVEIGGSRMRHSYRHKKRRRPHFRTYRRKKRSHYNRRRSHRNRKHRRSRKQKKSKGLFGFLFS